MSESSSNFALYITGFLVLIVGLSWAAYLLGVPPIWIGVGVVVLLGIGILSAVTRTRTPTTKYTYEDRTTPDRRR